MMPLQECHFKTETANQCAQNHNFNARTVILAVQTASCPPQTANRPVKISHFRALPHSWTATYATAAPGQWIDEIRMVAEAGAPPTSRLHAHRAREKNRIAKGAKSR